MQWSPDQERGIACVAAWLRTRFAPFFFLGGYAGTGKTTLAQHIAGLQDGKVAYAAYTGKAAKVMRKAGCAGAKTIHSLIYGVEQDEKTGEVTYFLKDAALEKFDLVIIDEVSMVDEELARDLLSFGKPILVLGDPGQLPPVKGGGFFTAEGPNFMLTEVHRQARDSAIVRVATDIREGQFRREELVADGLEIVRKANLNRDSVVDADTVLVGRNATRHAYNGRLRNIHGHLSDTPEVGEPVICLRNDKAVKISNGEMFTIAAKKKASKDKVGRKFRYVISDPDTARQIPVTVREQFFLPDDSAASIHWKALKGTQQLTYAYAITTHKAQGSQWPNVCVFDESGAFREDANRWLYTAVTRASEHLTLVI